MKPAVRAMNACDAKKQKAEGMAFNGAVAAAYNDAGTPSAWFACAIIAAFSFWWDPNAAMASLMY